MLSFQDKDIYLLDDPLAAVDVHVAVHLFHHCIMGLLKNKTRILCTHHTQFLSVADWVLVMDHGSVVDAGPPNEILEREQVAKNISANPSEVSEKPSSKNSANSIAMIEEEVKDEGLVREEEKEVGVVKLHVYKSYWLAIGRCLATSILLSLMLMQG